MAFQAQLAALAEELVDAVGIPESHHERRSACQDFVLHNIRHHSFTRTNQFEVNDRLNGFDERFRVVGRDALADAYRKRLDALEPFHDEKHMPDVLHFLLELADKPAQKTQLSDLDRLVEPQEASLPNLTWKEIAKEDGWKYERDIWQINSHAADSSDDEVTDARSVASGGTLTSASSVDERVERTALDLAYLAQGSELLSQIKDAQTWRDAPIADEASQLRKTSISTLQLLREILFMLGGLETTLFDADCNPTTTYQLRGISWDAYKALVTSFAECGKKLIPLRRFSKRREQSPLLQVFQNSLQKALRSFDQELAKIQSRYVAIEDDVVVSLVGVLADLRPILTPLSALSDIVRQVQEERNAHAFRYLELLYDAAGMAQHQGQSATYHLLGDIFFDCFQVYLKPIRLWMEEGRLVPNDRTFFVSESPTKLPLPQIWKSQFNLLRTPEGNLHAPRFLKPAIHRIFTAGKSIVLLQHMKRHSSTKKYQAMAEPKMDFATICPPELEYAPFPELFSAAFQAWIQSKHHTAAATLRELLYSSYGLSEGLDTLEQIYLMADGAKSDTFASAIFRYLDTFSGSWKDRFTLTEIAQEAFTSAASTADDEYRLYADIDPRSVVHSAIAARSSVRVSLPAIRLGCRLNWPVQIIIPEDGIQKYQTIFTFLLQTRRAISLLNHSIRDFHPSSSHSLSATGPMAWYYKLRAKLLWFCNAVTTYVTTIVLAPNAARLRSDLRDAADVDDMIKAHADFTTRIIHEACQGPKLHPIRDAILDIFDLTIKVADAQRAEIERLNEEEQEISRLSVLSSPHKSPAKNRMGGTSGMSLLSRTPRRPKRDLDEEEDYEGGDGLDLAAAAAGAKRGGVAGGEKPHYALLSDFHSDFERHLRFVAGGLRGVARASKEDGAVKWDLLAEMLEAGIKD
ncbi:putative gamma-tubulin complex component 5 [Podospora australis]|uniref:Spindle pole body component n=1 Tax=Podospora australis TaxID=1536484 RepID=A0AAN6X0E8_9PEZI|nr:putative gamma-tubulin complex component 5 [Podospora australis]